MKFKPIISAALLISAGVIFTGPVKAQTSPAQNREDSATINTLRQSGPAGIEEFLKLYSNQLQPNSNIDPKQRQQILATLDAICAQRDCYASQLYWYTDLEQAKLAAKTSGKPILSLRLLGNLDQELSCANSRFFRIALYPNTEISKFLREHYILHWQSVRPAPRLTIDFGDGRKLERTLTGNSIHYILDADGQPIDALPGLYAPQTFLRELTQIEKFVKQYSSRPPQERPSLLREYHTSRLTGLETAWKQDFAELGIPLPAKPAAENPPENPTALQAAPIALSKSRVELPVLRAISTTIETLAPATDESTWAKLADLHAADAHLDSNTIALMQSKNPKLRNTDNLQQVLNNFERNIALDTVRNEYLLRPRLHQWFLQGRDTGNVDTLNERVYAELFLTPSSDPWLGLLKADGYTGIENEGVIGNW